MAPNKLDQYNSDELEQLHQFQTSKMGFRDYN